MNRLQKMISSAVTALAFTSIALASVSYNHPETPADLIAKVAAKHPAPWVLAGVKKFAGKSTISYSSFFNYKLHQREPIPWTKFPINEYGPRPIKFNPSGMRSLPQIPPPGVHPRIFFTAEQIPQIRGRLHSTAAGRRAWNIILSWSNALRGTYNPHAAYAQPDTYDGAFNIHGNCPLFRMADFRNPKRYQALVHGDTNAKYLPDFMWAVFPVEAFRDLIENDGVHGKQVATAVATAVQIADNLRAAHKSYLAWNAFPPHSIPGGLNLPLAYDLAYQWFTPAQRRLIRRNIADYTAYHDNYGAFVTATNTRSNWTSFSYRMLSLLSTEGEKGYNPLQFYGMYRAWHNFLTYGLFKHGAWLEGEAKDQLGMDALIPMAMRCKAYGVKNLIAATHLRAFAHEFMPARTMPWGGEFLSFDLLGDVRKTFGMDMVGLHYMYPHDKIIDWLYRNQVGNHYMGLETNPGGYRNTVIFDAVFATNFNRANTQASLHLPLSYVSGQRSFMLTRSSWTPDASYLGFTVRGATGGHPYCDKNAIVFAGAGALWSSEGWDAPADYQNSEVTIDGHVQHAWTPGRMIAFINNKNATFGVGDASYCWDWWWRTGGAMYRGKPLYAKEVMDGYYHPPKGWQLEMHSMNDFSLHQVKYDYANTPMAIHPSWIHPDGTVSPFLRRPNYPVKMAYREAGLVRGRYPYALVVDDIQKDNSPHLYDWTLRLARGVRVLKVVPSWGGVRPPKNAGKLKPPMLDIYLVAPLARPKGSSSDPFHSAGTLTFNVQRGYFSIGRILHPANGAPELLVRVLEKQGVNPNPDEGMAYVVHDPAGARLVIPTQAVNPEFKVMLYAFHHGQSPLPQTTWSNNGTKLSVNIGQQHDQVVFGHGPMGNTTLAISRLERGMMQSLIDVDPVVKPLPRQAKLAWTNAGR